MKSIIFATLCVFVTCSGFCYEIVLKNGKTIKGNLVRQTDDAYIIRDESGLELRIKKQTVDSDKTTSANKEAENKEGRAQQSLTKVAKSEKPNLSSKTKVLTNDDIKDLPEISIIGSTDVKEDEQSVDTDKEKTKKDDNKQERQWKSEARQLIAEKNRATDNYWSLRTKCERAKDYGHDWVVKPDPSMIGEYPTAPTQEQIRAIARAEATCHEVKEAYEKMNAAEDKYSDFLRRAEDERIPPDWVEERWLELPE